MANQVFDRLLRQMPVRRRIIGGFLLILVIAGSVSPTILLSFNSLVQQLEQFTNVDVKIERLLLLTSRQVTTSQLNLTRYIQDYVPSPYEALDDVEQALQNLNEAQAISTNSDQTETITLIIRSLEEYQQLISNLQKARTSGNDDEATRLQSGLQKLGNDISMRLELVVNNNVKLVATTNEKVLSDARQSLDLGLVIITVSFILGVTFSALISLSITRPLAELRTGTEAFQKGDMSSTIRTAGADEFTVFAQILNSLTKQIRELVSGLETRVAERTADLASANRQNEKRANDLKTVSDVARAVSTETNLEKLLMLITDLVSERFGFYHVGVFLLDEASNFAVLRAANSPGGRKMLERGHRLEIGQVGIVGKVASTGQPRIALNVGEDVAYFNNPDLPETRSEMALPMTVANKIIGVLDVQSTKSSAFTNEDISTLYILADQVGIAIENARLYKTTRLALEQTEFAYRQYVQNEWMRFSREEKLSGYQYADGNCTPLEVPLDLGEAAQVAAEGSIYQSNATSGSSAQLAIPVKLRDEVIGTLHVSSRLRPRWTDDDIDIVESVAEHLALAIENARLFQVSANGAARERIVSDISSKISGNIRIDNILRTAAQELSQALNGSEVLIQLTKRESAAEVQE